ncbi:metallophosphoesterase family protein [Candidatus Bathyarchaeota archaeon]|nr:metallophosphoesterase family protein [Candidatus Bathyarchaeota archaeon]
MSRNNSRTLDTLREVLGVARKNKVDVLTVSGDLFESEEDAEALRPELRTKLFSGNEFQIIVIPGNHDREAYRKNLDFGSDLRILTKLPLDAVKQEKANIVGVPFLEKSSEELVASLREAKEKELVNILLLHCTLDISYALADFGEEKEREYFPIDSYTLSGLGFDYVLAGHFHADFVKKDLGGGSLFVYPGSPTSLSWKHLGKRKVALLDTEKGDVKEIPINSFYYDKLKVQTRPGFETKTLQEIREWVEGHAGEPCEVRIAVTGHGEMSESEFSELLKKNAGSAQIEENRYSNVEDVLRHPIYHDFKQLLQIRKDLAENKDDIDYRAIEVLSQLKAARKIL